MTTKVGKSTRQWLGVLATLLAYYLLHEGAHLLYALSHSAFKQINFLGLGVQIDVFPEKFTALQMGIFCLVGPLVTILLGWILTTLTPKLLKVKSLEVRAIFYYLTAGMLLLDPIYLSLLCGFFGGGDMNGIVMGFGVSELIGRLIFGLVSVFNVWMFIKKVYPAYKIAFKNQMK